MVSNIVLVKYSVVKHKKMKMLLQQLFETKVMNIYSRKTLQEYKRLARVHLIGCGGVKLFLPKAFFRYCPKSSFVKH